MQDFLKIRSVDEGGWHYLDPDDAGIESDLSVTGWQLMFLRSAKNAGFDIPAKPIDSAVDYVMHCYNREFGTFGYTADRSQLSRGMAGAGILALSMPACMTRPRRMKQVSGYCVPIY